MSAWLTNTHGPSYFLHSVEGPKKNTVHKYNVCHVYCTSFNEKSKNHCAQLQCISSTLYSLTSINCVVTVRGVADCRNLTDGRADIKCLSNGRKNLITLKHQTKKMYQSSREICLRKLGVRYA